MQIGCPQCRKILEFHEESAGLLVRCDFCGHAFRVPAAPPAGDPFGGLSDEPLWQHKKEHKEKNRRRMGRIIALAVGVGIGAIAGSGIAASWGMGLQDLLSGVAAAFVGAGLGSAAGVVFGLYLAKRKHHLMPLFLLIGACVGSLGGAIVGAQAAVRFKDPANLEATLRYFNIQALAPVALCAVAGAALGALPGAALFFLPGRRRE